MDVIGDVVRLERDLVAVVLRRPGIPFGVILNEQRYLLGKGYPMTD